MFRDRRSDADRWTAAFVAVLLAGAFFRLYRLGDESLWLDEIYSVLDATMRPLRELVLLPLVKLHLPLYYLVLRYWIELFGTSEAMVRTPSALFGIAAVGAIYLVGTRLYDRPVGVASAALLAFSKFHVYYSQEARMYSLLVLLSLLSFYGLLRVAEEASGWNVAGYLVATVLLAYTHPFSLFVILAQNVYVFTAPLLGRHDSLTIPLRRWIGLQAVVGALIGPWVLYAIYDVIAHDSAPGWISEPSLSGVAKLPATYLGWGWGSSERELLVGGDLLLAIRLGVLVLVLVLLLVGIANRPIVRGATNRLPTVEARRGTSHRAYLLVVWFLVPILVPTILSFVLSPMLSTRYTITASAGLFVLMANGIRHLRYAHLNVAIALLLVAALLFPLVGYYTVDHRHQWEEATDYVDANAESDDLILVSDAYARTPLLYYSERDDLRTVPVVNYAEQSELRPVVEDEGTVWFVFAHIDAHDRERLLAVVEETHERADHRSYYGVDVYRYEPADDRDQASSSNSSAAELMQ